MTETDKKGMAARKRATRAAAKPDADPSTAAADSAAAQAPGRACARNDTPHADAARAWARPDTAAFDAWQAQLRDERDRLLSERTLRQRQAMFGKFLRYLAGQGRTLLTAGAPEVENFVLSLSTRARAGGAGARGEGPAANDTRLRYARLISDTMAHLVEQGLRLSNEAAQVLPQFELKRGETRFTLPACLDRAQDQRLRAYLEAMPRTPWTANRLRALLHVLAGGGLTLAEAITMRVAKVDLDHTRLQTTDSPDKRAHDVPLASWCVPALAHWMEQLRTIAPGAQLLFPSSTGGRIDAAVHLIDEPIAENSVYLAVSAALQAIGYDGGDRGPTVLRNTYALRNLAHGIDPNALRGYLGLETDYQLWKIGKRLGLWVEQGQEPM